MYRFLPLIFVAFIYSCSDSSESPEELDIEQEMDDLSEDLLEPVWTMRSDGEFFEIELPTQMEETDRLNPDADLQYRFVNLTESDTLEHFIIVMTEDFPDDKVDSVDLIGFTEAYLDSLMGGRPIELLNEPAIETVNEMETIIHEFTSSFTGPNDTEIALYYMFGVFKGEKAIYQVLTWTLGKQQDIFKGDMKHIMYSFHELHEH